MPRRKPRDVGNHRRQPRKHGVATREGIKVCIATGKTRFGSQRAAEAVLNSIRAISDREVVPSRVYECEDGCGGWHLTSIQRPWHD